MLVPAMTVAGPVLVTARSAELMTVVLTVELLLLGVGSVVLLLTEVVLLMVEPSGSDELAVTTIWNVAVAPAAKLAALAVKVVVPLEVRLNGGPLFAEQVEAVVPA